MLVWANPIALETDALAVVKGATVLSDRIVTASYWPTEEAALTYIYLLLSCDCTHSPIVKRFKEVSEIVSVNLTPNFPSILKAIILLLDG